MALVMALPLALVFLALHGFLQGTVALAALGFVAVFALVAKSGGD